MTTVVLIDDDEDIRILGRLALETEGHDVLVADGAERGLAILRALPADVDPVVVLDVQMPAIDGWEVLDMLRNDESLRDVAVLVCTVRASDEDRARGAELGADAYQAKPFDLTDFRATVGALAHSTATERQIWRAGATSEP